MKWLVPLLVTFACGVSHSQFIEWSFPAPSDHISGLAMAGSTEDILVVDSVLYVVYRMDGWSGEIQDTIPLPYLPEPPVGLACTGDSLWFALAGTATVYAMTTSGAFLGMWDLSDSGPQSICGLGYHDYYDNDLLLADAGQGVIYCASYDEGFADLDTLLVPQDCPTIHDVGGQGVCGIPVACEDPASPVRIYWDDHNWEVLGFGDYESAVGVERFCGDRFYFSDPDMGLIHRYCESMGGAGEPPAETGLSLGAFPNPFADEVLLEIELPAPGRAALRIFDLTGRLVSTLLDTTMPAGPASCSFDAGWLPAGVYIARLRAGDACSSLRLILVE
ncbi:T9SS type A sorting domain-containing protein [Candidatus Fermentibacterales bacterium]|nr:T9SS type A sorting domain-containing protein [Candidatus Fermentibacterales bacterium]